MSNKTIVQFTEEFIKEERTRVAEVDPLKDVSSETLIALRNLALEANRAGYKIFELIDTKPEPPKNNIPEYEPIKRKKVKVDFSFPHKVTYLYDGYGRLARFIDGAFEPKESANTRIILGHPREITRLNPEEKIIFLTMFEANRIPDRWVEACNKYADAIIVPSRFCEKVFKESGVVKPIAIVPLFADKFEVVNPPLRPFVFAHQNSFVEGSQKGTDIVLRAFLNVFHKHTKDQVLLYLKGRNHRWANDTYLIKEAMHSDKVKVMLADLNESEMEVEFWQNINCFVYPSRGEGFGLPPMEAMARGIPTILTNAHSMADFAEFGLPVGIKGETDSYYVGRVWDYGIGQWVEPDIKQVEKYMWDIFHNYESYKQKAVANVDKLKTLYSPETFISNLIETVKKL